MEPLASLKNATAKSLVASAATSRIPGSAAASVRTAVAAPSTSQGTAKIRRLVAYQRYFGIEARAFHAGARRMLARISAATPRTTRITVRSLGEDFHLDPAASWTLLRALVAAKLLHGDGAGSYVATARFREYALASVVVPLSRVRAKALVDAVCGIAAHVNADWDRNPYLVRLIAVSGSYMSRRKQLPELSLWLVLRRRPQLRTPRWKRPLDKDAALREIVAAVCAPSSFIRLRFVRDKQDVQRPFSVVFQTREDIHEPSQATWERLRDWGASISRRLVAR